MYGMSLNEWNCYRYIYSTLHFLTLIMINQAPHSLTPHPWNHREKPISKSDQRKKKRFLLGLDWQTHSARTQSCHLQEAESRTILTKKKKSVGFSVTGCGLVGKATGRKEPPKGTLSRTLRWSSATGLPRRIQAMLLQGLWEHHHLQI